LTDGITLQFSKARFFSKNNVFKPVAIHEDIIPGLPLALGGPNLSVLLAGCENAPPLRGRKRRMNEHANPARQTGFLHLVAMLLSLLMRKKGGKDGEF
jgi:hypothetical protein